MSDFRVYVKRSDAPGAKEQPFYVTLVAANGETLMTSERYVNRLHAVSLAEDMAARYDANLIDET